jgi:hypothetical protein
MFTGTDVFGRKPGVCPSGGQARVRFRLNQRGTKPLEGAVHPERAAVAATPAANPAATGLRDTAIATAAGLLVLLASFANLLTFHEYPWLQPEVGLAVLLFVALAVCVGGLYAAVGSLGRTLLQIFLVFLAFELNFGMTVAVVGTPAVMLVLRRHAMPFVAIAAAVVLLTEAIGLGAETADDRAQFQRTAGVASADAPILVHLILDEHVGVEGLLGDAPEVDAMRDRLLAFYADKGFRHFGGAYSRHFYTSNSVPETLNFGTPQPEIETDLAANAWFDRLGELGFAIHVRQTEHLRYCDNDFVVSCRTRRTYDAYDLVDANLPAVDKATLLINEMALLSRVINAMAATYNIVGNAGRYAGLPVLPYYGLRDHRLPAAIGGLNTIDEVSGILRKAMPGNAYFVHVLVPHHPFVFNAGCGLLRASEWRDRSGSARLKPLREISYFDQITCLLTHLEALLENLEANPAGRNAVVLVHGDHGSRITDVDPTVETVGEFSDADLIASYSTLFAVKGPGIDPGYEPRRVSVAMLLKALADAELGELAPPMHPDAVHQVILQNEIGEPVKPHPLPDWWVDPP